MRVIRKSVDGVELREHTVKVSLEVVCCICRNPNWHETIKSGKLITHVGPLFRYTLSAPNKKKDFRIAGDLFCSLACLEPHLPPALQAARMQRDIEAADAEYQASKR